VVGVMGVSENPPLSRGGGPRSGGGGAASGTALAKRKSSLRKKTVDEARKLRRSMTLPEALLWRELKGAKLGHSFRMQHPIGSYKADFCCTEHKLVIEVDGMVHDVLDQALHDEKRDAYLAAQGFRVMRIAAKDVLRDLGAVVISIAAALPPLHRASAVPLPVNGEDL
jgi:very-short-patch-repair endonuclease